MVEDIIAREGTSNTTEQIRQGNVSKNISKSVAPRPLAQQFSSVFKELEFDGKLATSQGKPSELGVEDNTGRGITSMVKAIEEGVESQKSLVLFEVQQIISHCNSKEYAINHLIPVICKHLPSWSHDLQMCAAEALAGLTGGMITGDVATSICDAAFAVLRQQQDPDMFRLWGENLATALPHVKWTETQLEQILVQIDEQQKHNNLSQTLARKLTARIIGPIAMAASPELAEKVLLVRALQLSKDRNVDVRGMVVESMALIGSVLQIHVVEQQLWPSLLQLAEDPNARIHAATLRTIARIAAAHRDNARDGDFFGALLAPLFARECHFIRKTAPLDQRYVSSHAALLLETNSEIFGELLYSCHQSLSSEILKKETVKAFQAMSTCNGRVVRRRCAFNVPGVALSFAKQCSNEVGIVVETLSRDTDAESRWTLAAGLHETSKVLCCNDTFDNLFRAVNSLIHDKHGLVRMKILQNMDVLLGTLTSHNPYKAMSRLETVFQNLQHLSEGNWRTQELLAKQLKLVASLVPPKCIRENVLPLLYQLIYESPYTVRRAAMAAVAVCLRCLPDTKERDEVMESFVIEWGQGTAFWMRLGFLDSAETALSTYSRILFRDTYAARLLQLAQDPVPNVRIKAASLMHKIAPACHQMEEYEVAYRALNEDNDIDVKHVLEGMETRILQSVEQSKKSFEEDMLRESEEQTLYSKHLKLQAEVKKKQAGMKHKTNAFLERAKRVGGVVSGTNEAGAISLLTPTGSKANVTVSASFPKPDSSSAKSDSPPGGAGTPSLNRLAWGPTASGNSSKITEIASKLSPKCTMDRALSDKSGMSFAKERHDTVMSIQNDERKSAANPSPKTFNSIESVRKRCQELNLGNLHDDDGAADSQLGAQTYGPCSLSPRARTSIAVTSISSSLANPQSPSKSMGNKTLLVQGQFMASILGNNHQNEAAKSSDKSSEEVPTSPASFKKTFIKNSNLAKAGDIPSPVYDENEAPRPNNDGNVWREDKSKKRHQNSRNGVKAFMTLLSPRAHFSGTQNADRR